MGDVEAMMDPEEKSTIIHIFKRHNNQHGWLRVLIYKEIKWRVHQYDFESLASCIIQWFGQKKNNSTDF